MSPADAMGTSTSPPARRPIRRYIAWTLILSVVGGGAALWARNRWKVFIENPVAPPNDVVLQITGEESLTALSEKLVHAHIVQDAGLFRLHISNVRRVASQLKPGEYLFHAGQPETPDEVIDRLLRGEFQPAKVTIPIGLRIEEEAPLLDAAGLAGGDAFIHVAHERKFVHSLGIKAHSLEGYLFPDQYLVPKDYTPAQIARLMVERFRGAWAAASAVRGPGVNLTQHEAVTLASILQKEGRTEADWLHLSCVFHNRLRNNMKLEAASTVKYSLFVQTGLFPETLREADFETPHPYNTFTAAGLPPGPISNPGLQALKAALNPGTCNDVYVVTEPDGSLTFCADAACRDANQHKAELELYFHAQPPAATAR